MFLIKTNEICKVKGDLEEASEGDWIQFERNPGGEGSCLCWEHMGREGGVYGGAPHVIMLRSSHIREKNPSREREN